MVIAIVAILAALLLPALEQARYQARVTSCAGRHRQMYLATSMYVNDYTWCPPSCPQQGIGAHNLYRYYAPTGDLVGFAQGGLLWKLQYLAGKEVLLDPDWYCSGPANALNDYTNICINGQVNWSGLEGASGNGTVTGCYAFYGYRDPWNLGLCRKLEPVYANGLKSTSLLQCRLGLRYSAPWETGGHDNRTMNSTHHDGHTVSLRGTEEAAGTYVLQNYDNEGCWFGFATKSWWDWATEQDQ